VELTNPKVIQATMGSFTRIKMVYANITNYLSQQTHRTIYGLFMNGEPIHKQLFKHNDVAIIGSESHGISEATATYVNTKIAIPIFSQENSAPESLNAAIAAGIYMHAFRTT
jgi:TrmH family RNA methyltransferase